MIKPENYLRDSTKMPEGVRYLADSAMYSVSLEAQAAASYGRPENAVDTKRLAELDMAIASLAARKRPQA